MRRGRFSSHVGWLLSFSFATGTTTVCLWTTSTTANTREALPESEKSTTVPATSAVSSQLARSSSDSGRKTSDTRKLTSSPFSVEDLPMPSQFGLLGRQHARGHFSLLSNATELPADELFAKSNETKGLASERPKRRSSVRPEQASL